MNEKTVIEKLIELAKNSLAGRKIDPFDAALETSESLYMSLLDLNTIEKLPEAIREETRIANRVAEITASRLACDKSYVEKARKFFANLLLGRIAFSPASRCIFVKKISTNFLQVDCLPLEKALYYYLAGDFEPILAPVDPL